MGSLKAEVRVDLAIGDLWKIVGDYGNPNDWSPYVDSAEIISDVSSGAGAVRTCVIPGFGDVEERITDWQEGVGFSFDVKASGPVETARSTVTLRASGAATTVVYEIEFKLRDGLTTEEQTGAEGYFQMVLKESLLGLKHFAETGQKIGNVLPDGLDASAVVVIAA